MRRRSALTAGAAAWLLALVVVAGCASTEVTERQRYQGAKLARPDRIIVHDFTGNPADVPPESPFAAELAGTIPPTPEQREVGRKLGAQIAKQLVADLQGHGAARRAGCGPTGAAGRRHRAAGLFRLHRRGQRRQARAGRVRQRHGRDEGGGRRLPDDRSGSAPPRQRRGPVRRWQDAGHGGPSWPFSPPPPTRSAWSSVARRKLYGEATGSDTIEGAAKRTADEIAAQLQDGRRRAGLDLVERAQAANTRRAHPRLAAQASEDGSGPAARQADLEAGRASG